MKRYAIVTGRATKAQVASYLPDNYRVIPNTDEAVILVEGIDDAGWTLDDYVIPRLLSGLIGCREIDLSDPVMKTVPVSPSYVVVENTPGYLPESDPAQFDNYDDAIAYARSLADELVEQGYPEPTCDHSTATTMQWHTSRGGRDLGRVIELTTV